MNIKKFIDKCVFDYKRGRDFKIVSAKIKIAKAIIADKPNTDLMKDGYGKTRALARYNMAVKQLPRLEEDLENLRENKD